MVFAGRWVVDFWVVVCELFVVGNLFWEMLLYDLQCVAQLWLNRCIGFFARYT
jgi:hypothetical protein